MPAIRNRLPADARNGINAIRSPVFLFPVTTLIRQISAAMTRAVSAIATAALIPVNNPQTIRQIPSPSPILPLNTKDKISRSAPGAAPAQSSHFELPPGSRRSAATAAVKKIPGIHRGILFDLRSGTAAVHKNRQAHRSRVTFPFIFMSAPFSVASLMSAAADRAGSVVLFCRNRLHRSQMPDDPAAVEVGMIPVSLFCDINDSVSARPAATSDADTALI